MARLLVRDQYNVLPDKRPGEKRFSLRPYRVSYEAQILGAEGNDLEAQKAAAKVADATGFAVLTYDLEDEED